MANGSARVAHHGQVHLIARHQRRELPAVAVEAGHTDTWYKYVRRQGRILGMHGFGESAPSPELMVHLGFTADGVIAAARAVLGMLGASAHTQLVPGRPKAAEIPSGGWHRSLGTRIPQPVAA
jgi:pyruvate dehydrogenase complex dehydrogenase (E1) component